MKFKINLLAAAIFAGMFFCSLTVAQKIDYDFVPGTDFSKYKTYKWQRAEKAKYPGDGIDKMLMRTIDAELALKGLTKVENEPCDVYVIYQLAIEEKMEWSSYKPSSGWEGVGTDGVPGLRVVSPSSTSLIRIGSLILDIYDVSQKKLIWQAHATKTLHPSGDFKKNEKNTQKVIAKILKNYPPSAK